MGRLGHCVCSGFQYFEQRLEPVSINEFPDEHLSQHINNAFKYIDLVNDVNPHSLIPYFLHESVLHEPDHLPYYAFKTNLEHRIYNVIHYPFDNIDDHQHDDTEHSFFIELYKLQLLLNFDLDLDLDSNLNLNVNVNVNVNFDLDLNIYLNINLDLDLNFND
ncbi:hypothetical protein CLAIMM_08961 [Cladophialophora immunda]|nr:hypothetical protein CLAIMM_08961 [Cladophialophora immunda]